MKKRKRLSEGTIQTLHYIASFIVMFFCTVSVILYCGGYCDGITCAEGLFIAMLGARIEVLTERYENSLLK